MMVFDILLRAIVCLGFMIPVMYEVSSDSKDFEKGIEDKHAFDVVVRQFFILIISLGLGIYKTLWSDTLLFNVIQCFSIGNIIFFSVFDYVLNKHRGKPWYYLGKQSLFDRLLKRINPYVLLVLRFVLVVLSVIAYVT